MTHLIVILIQTLAAAAVVNFFRELGTAGPRTCAGRESVIRELERTIGDFDGNP